MTRRLAILVALILPLLTKCGYDSSDLNESPNLYKEDPTVRMGKKAVFVFAEDKRPKINILNESSKGVEQTVAKQARIEMKSDPAHGNVGVKLVLDKIEATMNAKTGKYKIKIYTVTNDGKYLAPITLSREVTPAQIRNASKEKPISITHSDVTKGSSWGSDYTITTTLKVKAYISVVKDKVELNLVAADFYFNFSNYWKGKHRFPGEAGTYFKLPRSAKAIMR